MKYEILASGSAGNATIINDEILIDCGVPLKTLAPYKDKLKIVLLTHEHGDHFKPSTVAALAKSRPTLRWAACEWMIPKLVYIGVRESQIDVIQLDQAVSYEGIAAIMPQKLVHDVPNCCWHIFTKSGSLFYATDTGTLDGIEAKGYDLYLVEANHKKAEIEERFRQKRDWGYYSYEIRAAENHLSEEQAQDWLTENMSQKSEWIPMHQHREIEKEGKSNGKCARHR